MSTHKHIDKICIFVTVLVLLLTGLFMNGKAFGITVMESEEKSSELFTASDLNADWDITGATEITLSDEGTTVKGNGAYVYNGDAYIAYAGKYILSGKLTNGSIIINADGNDKIWLMLNGVSIHCEDDAAIRIEQADKVFITLADETENTLSSGSQYKADVISAGVDGTIYSRDDLTINGNGALYVTAQYQHGIVCNDDLALTGGSVKVEAVQDGVHANDSVRIKDTDINISAGDDGITVSNDSETAFLYIESGNINISSCYEGLEAIDITIAGGTIDITPTDDGINANGSGNSSVIRITGGDITITNASGRDADGLDSNKDIYISGGKLFISVAGDGSNSAIDYGTEHGGVCEISGGTVIACGSGAMAEGFDSSSTQGFLMYNTSAGAGTIVSLESADGSVILSEEIPYNFSSVVISTPEMAVGDTCVITIGEISEEIVIDNSSSNAGFSVGKMFGSGKDRNNMPLDFKANSNETPSGMQMPPDDQEFGGMNGGRQGDTPLELPDEMMLENGERPPEPGGTNNGDTQPAFSQDGNWGGGPNGNEMQRQEKGGALGDSIREELEPEGPNDDSLFSAENIILLGVSVIILILGCAVAFAFKRR